ncbi:hypothetical protein [Vibrio sp. ABG19]|uniref:hypothetical protein n=1 Tax=Vibrio sp. ABG19 TaxID=2817385 RepID=UPI00249E4D23|nr:hypothetical protein [Vibrio sp. ABG19]WGY44782.1 hypothetical protein J0X00_03460 [Vibrio sp. ABG19]
MKKRSVLLAAAIAAILSGCGGDEGESSNGHMGDSTQKIDTPFKQGEQSAPNLLPQGEPVTQVLERNLVPVIHSEVVQAPQPIPFEVSDEFIGTYSVPVPEDKHALLKSEERLINQATLTPMAELHQYMSDLGLITSEGTYDAAAITVRDILNQDIRDGKDPQISLERAKVNTDRVANQYGLTTPIKLDNNRTPGTPIVSGEPRKEREQPLVKPVAMGVNIPLATTDGPGDVVQLTIVPPEDRMTLISNSVVSQIGPGAIQTKSFKKSKWEAQKEERFILNGYPQEGWVTSVGILPSEMATLEPTPKATTDVAPAHDIKLGEAPVAKVQFTPIPKDEQLLPPAVIDAVPSLRPQGEPVTQVLERNLVPVIHGEVVQAPQPIPFEVSDEFIGTYSVPVPEDKHALLKSEERLINQATLTPMAELHQYMSDLGLITSEGTYDAAAITVRDILNQDIRDGKDPQISLERAKVNTDRVANQYGLTTPIKLDNNRTPGTPIVSGEPRKGREQPLVKPVAMDVNIPLATTDGPGDVVQLTIVPPEDRMTLISNSVVSQDGPGAIQTKSFKKSKWEAQKEERFILNGYPQEGWVTSVGILPSEMATLEPTPKATTDVAPAYDIKLGETPEVVSQGEPERITYEETFTGFAEVAPQGYNIPVEPDNEAPTYLTPEIVKQQTEKLDSVCLTNTQQFVQSYGGTLNSLGGSGNHFQEIKKDLTSDVDRLSYSMEIFAMLQQALSANPDLRQAIAQQHAGGSNNSHVKATWTLSMDTGASYTLSTDSSQAYRASIEVVVNNQGAVVVNDGNGIELARIVSTARNGNCDNASYDVVIANE